jgi:cap2 methyltransferase
MCALVTNPHSMQAAQPRTDLPFGRLLLPDAPMTEYRPREGAKTVNPWGQRKLLMSEIEFLTLAPPPEGTRCVVIYAGAAPGTHVRILSEMFPLHRFVLVDPANFTVRADGDRIITRRALFSAELANELKTEYEGWHMLFVSDVRSADFQRETKEENEQRIRADMDAQALWHTILRPFKSMLKFRLPFTPGTTQYLKGDIYLPVWGPVSTTECRLVVDTYADETLYDHTEHEQKLYHFNNITRPALYDHSVVGEGIDHCYDCTAEIHILDNYLKGRSTIAELSANISRSISHGRRTLADPAPNNDERIRVIRARQWVNGRPAYERR